MARLDIDTLAAFVSIVDTGSFTLAGHRVGKSQAAVSAAIVRLEERVGHRLLNRTARTLSLTAEGELLCGYARRLLALEQDAIAAMGGVPGTGRVRLGMPDDYIGLFGVSVMEHFSMRHKDVAVEVVCEFSHDLEPMVQNGEIDLAIVTRRAGDTHGELLKRERQHWCAAVNAFPERQEELPLALFPENCRARPRILKALNNAGRRWRVVWVSSHLQSVQSAVMLGFGVTALPQSALTFEHRVLTEADGLPPLPELELVLIQSPGIGVAGRRLAHFLRAEFSAGPEVAAAS
ncbi:LysR family transcriptional regulator [Rhodobacter sp. Har01]|uniref:LysR substrate-binding domain-containing protein n=1 Tax=Rhodobacter sp. Har01 TaxID=2883999 RepID=UPI001D07C490|nr:LysR substrate-binding domain-containing protein [Rhodobacter sp. Har01]MCB6179078.1 LysR family transcriptional regulator [Rhodobacter sp. Har01]